MLKTFKTRLVAKGEQTTTEATIDFSNVSTDELQTLAAATVIINQQAIYRISGKIPAKDVIFVRKQIDSPKGGFVSTPESLAARAMKFTDEQKAELLAMLMKK